MTAPPRASDAGCELIDPASLGNLRRFREALGSDALEELLATFADETTKRVACMRSANGAGDFDTVATAAHNLRGASLSLAAKLLAARCAQVEAFAAKKDRTGCKAVIDDLELRALQSISRLRLILAQPTLKEY